MATPLNLQPPRPLVDPARPTNRFWNRRRFLGTCLAACCASGLRAQFSNAPQVFGALPISVLGPTGSNDFRGGKVEWARLHNPGVYWNRHAESDPELLDFIRRNTSLNIDPTWRAASGKSLPDLCNYPFLYTDRVENLDATDTRNLAEYLRRGGFLFIDCCCNTGINPSPDLYLANQLKFLNIMLPGAAIEPIPNTHDVYSTYFKMERRPPRAMPGNSWMDTRPFPLHLIRIGKRLTGMLSMSGLQCGWAHVGSPANAQECLQMMTNIYLYAITH